MKLKLPLFAFLKGYTWKRFGSDAKAGLNVALLDMPQGMAYAMIAGLPVNFGIYSSSLGSISGALFGSSRFLMLGPTNASAVLLLSGYLSLGLPTEQRILALPLLLLMIAAMMFVGALIRADVIIRYVSRSVITGYVTAAAFLIVVNQLKHSLGITAPQASSFAESLLALGNRFNEVDIPTACLSMFTVTVALICKRWVKWLPNIAFTLLLTAVVAQLAHSWGYSFESLPKVPVGIWPTSFPVFDYQQIHDLIGVAGAVAFLSLLESSSIAKSLSAREGERVDIRQQMISMGVANVANAFGSGMPVSGSLTRSTLNYNSGAKTPMSSLVSGLLLACAALMLGPAIGFIPKASLASLVILVGVSLVKMDTIKVLFGATRSDAITFAVTFGAGLLFPLDIAIYSGVGISLILFLKKVSAPDVVEYSFNERGELAEIQRSEQDKRPAISIMHVEGDLFFGSIDVFEEQLRSLVGNPQIRAIVLRLKNAHNLDASGALAIGDFAEQAKERGVHVVVSGATAPILRILKKTGLVEKIGVKNIYRYTPSNVTLSTRNALKRAQQLIGVDTAEIMLFSGKREG